MNNDAKESSSAEKTASAEPNQDVSIPSEKTATEEPNQHASSSAEIAPAEPNQPTEASTPEKSDMSFIKINDISANDDTIEEMLSSNGPSKQGAKRKASKPADTTTGTPKKNAKTTEEPPMTKESPESTSTTTSTTSTSSSNIATSSDEDDDGIIVKTTPSYNTMIIGDSHSRRWRDQAAGIYNSIFPEKTAKNWAAGGKTACKMRAEVEKEPLLYADPTTDVVIINVGTNDILNETSSTSEVVVDIRETANHLFKKAPSARIFICAIPPLRKTETVRTGHEKKSDQTTRARHEPRRQQINDDLKTLTNNYRAIAAILTLPEDIESGNEQNYISSNDNIHLSSEAYGKILLNNDAQIARYIEQSK
jgi:lysophospholipase L1-like esterase